MSLRSQVKRSKALTCLYYVVDDARARRRLKAGDIETDSGRRHATRDIDSSLAYIKRIYEDYLSYAGIEAFDGRVCEIGPGDSFGLALMALGSGAQSVVAIDRFYSRRDLGYQKALYQRIADEHDWHQLFDGDVSEGAIRGLDYRPGCAAEVFFRDAQDCFDFIISRAVLEHLYDPLAALDDMSKRLEEGGMLVHRVDLRDHGMFENHHPLTFLTVSDGLYKLMTRSSGRPNRVLVHEYRQWLDRSSLDGEILVTRLAGVPEEIEPVRWAHLSDDLRARAIDRVREVRPRLARRFAALPDEVLAVSGFVLVARNGQSRRPADRSAVNSNRLEA